MAANSPSLGVAADLGFGQQVKDETEEQRRKRMMDLQQKQLLGPSSSLASATLFGGSGAGF
jgi:hypothetical protein